jgi:glyoxylate carboligase
VRQRGAIGRTVQHVKVFRRIEAEVFRVRRMRDVAPGLEEAVDGDALFEMLAIVPAVEFGLIRWIDIHRGQQHACSGQRHVGRFLSR